MITYRHKAFIEQAVRSVQMQTLYPECELIIGNDSADDATRALIEKIADGDSRIQIVHHQPRVGMMKNFRHTLNRCRGEFVAMLEGDDYWLDPQKLEKQIRVFQKHPNASFSFHRVIVRDETKAPPASWISNRDTKSEVTLHDLIGPNFIFTCSAIFRRSIVAAGLPDWFLEMPIGDWPLYLTCSQNGPGIFQRDVMGVYRIHTEGSWGPQAALAQHRKWVKGVALCHDKFGDEIKSSFKKYLSAARRHTFRLLTLRWLMPKNFAECYRVQWLKSLLRPLLFGRKCPLCQQKCFGFRPIDPKYVRDLKQHGFIFDLRVFETLNAEEYLCPRCGGSDRDRLLWLYIQKKFSKRSLNILDFAPSPIFSEVLRGTFGKGYRTADYLRDGFDLKLDIGDMREIPSDSIDLVICSHILEHVEEPAKAMGEIQRILKIGGEAIFLVPLPLDLTKTLANVAEVDRILLLGQSDHCTMFAKADFLKLITDAKLEVREVEGETLTDGMPRKYGILPPSRLYVATKSV